MYIPFRQAALAVTGLLMVTSVANAASTLPDFVPLAKSTGPAVVNISTERTMKSPMGNMGDLFRGMPPGFERFFEQFGPQDPGGQAPKQSSLGSGFIISADGYIVTNNHVVEEAEKVFVNLQGSTDKKEQLEAVVVGTDPETDLALLKVTSDKPLPVLPFGDSDALEVGEWVMAIGNPFGLSNTVTAGILSAKGRDIHAGNFDNFLQTDASINPGNSGGPLINMKGEVVGINTAIIASGQGIGFAIPSNSASRIIAELKEGKKVSRGWLGVTIQDLDEDMAKALGMKNAHGALIGDVLPDEPAAKAGLKAGDIIVKVGKEPVTNSSELLRSVADLKPDTPVDVVIYRNGKEQTVSVKLGERASKAKTTPEIAKEENITLGLSLRPLTKDDLRGLQLPADAKGLVITNVEPRSPAAQSGLRTGDVIVSANLTPVLTVEDLSNIITKEAKDRGALMLQINRNGQLFFVTLTLAEKK